MSISRSQFLKLCSQYAVTSYVVSKIPFLSVLNEQENLKLKHARSKPYTNLYSALNSYTIVEDYLNDHLMIFAYHFIINPTTLPSDKNISIYAFRVSLIGAIKIPGKNVFIFANELICEDEAVLDVSGSDGQAFLGSATPLAADCYKHGVRLADGSVVYSPPDADNVNENGEIQDSKNMQGPDKPNTGRINGKDSGNIFLNFLNLSSALSLVANGGRGGKGETGYSGLNGCDPQPDGNWGVFAFNGMDAGKGALGGYGGNGGEILLTGNQESALSVNAVNLKGSQGDSGDPGNPGSGGIGIVGIGQTKSEFDDSTTPARNTPGKSTQYPNGKAGKAALSPVNSHTRDGKFGVSKSLFGSESIYKVFIPFEFVKLLLLKAESLYLNSNFAKDDVYLKEASTLLVYIIEISGKRADQGLVNAGESGMVEKYLLYLKSYAAQAPSDQDWAAIHQKSSTYLAQMSLGLDIFANPANYAPNLNIDYLTSRYNQSIPLVKGFELFAKSLNNQQTDLLITQIKNLDNENQCLENIKALTKNIQENVSLARLMDGEILLRFNTIGNLKNNLITVDAAFRKAVEEKSNGCSLDQMVHCITAVVAVASAVYTLGATSYTAVLAIGSAIQSVKAIEALSQIKTVVDQVQDVRKKLGEVKTDYQKVQTAYRSLNLQTDKTPPSLLGVDTAEFDKTINQFLDLPEATAYKTRFHDFVDYVNMTNQKRIEVTGVILRINSDTQSILSQTAALNQLKAGSLRSASQQMTHSDKIAFYELYYNTKWAIIRQLYLQNKALGYQFPLLQTPAHTYHDTNFNSLNADAYKNNISSLLNLDNSAFSRVDNRNLNALRIELADYPLSRLDFLVKKRNSITDESYFAFEFKISPPLQSTTIDENDTKVMASIQSAFSSNTKNIKAMGLLVNLIGDPLTKEKITLRFTHSGDSLVTTLANFQGQLTFRHSPKPLNLQTAVTKTARTASFSEDTKTNIVGNALGNGEHTALGVSPFTTWKMEVYLSDNQKIQEQTLLETLKTLKSIDMYFWHYFQYV